MELSKSGDRLLRDVEGKLDGKMQNSDKGNSKALVDSNGNKKKMIVDSKFINKDLMVNNHFT